jgi:hypothetical protein|tara:strand:- start:1622 stop:2671 length:1050 start_codon:yes stop_codon:yes gene_type:complete
MFKKKFLVLLTLLITSSCEAPTTISSRGLDADTEKEKLIMQGIALETYYKRVEKLNNIAWPILQRSTSFCRKNIKQSIGLEIISINEIAKEYRKAASNKLNFTEESEVLFVIDQSPASKSGLAKGDIIKSIYSEDFSWTNDDIIKNSREKDFGNKKLNIIVKRNNEDLNFEVLPTKICNHKIILSQDNSLNAFADGKNIYITQGMLRFIEDDKELQMIIAHELAHNIEGHIEKKSNNFILGTLVDLAASSAGINTRGTFGNMGAQMYSQDFEREADYVGMYILANSDINREGVANFWRRMSVENPGSISYASSHPSSSERWVNIEAVNKEIDSKITKSLPLIPERIKNN